ncbi:MFS general substrate transporter, partial [Aureobasidium melanogenum]
MPTHISRLLLRKRGNNNNVHHHFPTQQLFVLALCRICEPIAFMSIFPYAYRMIESFNITQDETRVSVYAGMLITAFAFAEFSTGMVWGRISDRIGRKPVLLFGLFGTALSMILFGFARTLPAAVMARALGGLLNGNVGVLQTTVGELVTKKEHQPRAYSIMPFVWSMGSIIGPAMGGALAMPCDSYPSVFPRGGLFDKYPFLLPNLFCVFILVLGIVNGILFLEETHAEKRGRRDFGRECGRLLLEKLSFETRPREVLSRDRDDSDPPPGYRSTESSPILRSTTTEDLDAELGGLHEKESRKTCKTFHRHVVLIIVAYAILAYHSVSFDALMPTFLSEEPQQAEVGLPFKFSGGFGLPTKTIGFMMAVQGFYSMFAQLGLFPFVVRRVGILRTSRAVMTVWPLLYFAVPYLALLPEHLQRPGIYFSLITKTTFQAIAFPANAILLANAVPSKSVLGTVNGAASSTACLARALGPVVTGYIHSAGLKLGYSGLAWWAGGLVCAVGALESYWMEESEGRLGSASHEQEESSCEPLLHSVAIESPDENTLPSSKPTLMDDLDLAEPMKLDTDSQSKE